MKREARAARPDDITAAQSPNVFQPLGLFLITSWKKLASADVPSDKIKAKYSHYCLSSLRFYGGSDSRLMTETCGQNADKSDLNLIFV